MEVSLTTESVAVNDGMHMGMVGLNYQRLFTPHWLGGMSVYGATQGNREWLFFAWGLNGAYRLHHGPWQAEAGLFVGGGGGSPPWVGSGLMLRPHLEIAHAWGPLSAGLGVSWVSFPDGLVRSSQPYASLRWTTDAFIGSGSLAGLPTAVPDTTDAQTLDTEFVAVLGGYSMRQSPRRNRSGGTPMLQFGGLSFAIAAHCRRHPSPGGDPMRC